MDLEADHDLVIRFLDVVAAGRPGLTREKIRTLADGRIYSAPQALSEGLVDEVGSIDTAVSTAERSAGLERSRVVTYHRPREHRANLYSASLTTPRFDLDIRRALPQLPSAAFLYLWPAAAH